MTIDESGNLNAVFKGTQLWSTDLDGLDFTNNRVDISPPNQGWEWLDQTVVKTVRASDRTARFGTL